MVGHKNEIKETAGHQSIDKSMKFSTDEMLLFHNEIKTCVLSRLIKTIKEDYSSLLLIHIFSLMRKNCVNINASL